MPAKAHDIAKCIEHNLNQFFRTLDGENANDVYHMVLRQVEKPLLQTVMKQCHGNQSKAAMMLGLNRNTLRKKLLEHDLMNHQ